MVRKYFDCPKDELYALRNDHCELAVTFFDNDAIELANLARELLLTAN